MEERKTNIQFAKTGRGSTTTRITLPVPWVKQLGLTQDDREVTIILEQDRIIIKKG